VKTQRSPAATNSPDAMSVIHAPFFFCSVLIRPSTPPFLICSLNSSR
jgi:hypothetical protein